MQRWIPPVVALLGCSGCFLFDTGEETSLGRFEVTSTLAADNCGPGTRQGAIVEHYEVSLSRRGNVLYWRGPGGTRQGAVGEDRSFCIEDSGTWHVRDADPWTEDPGCDMARVERLCGVLDPAKSSSEDGSEETETIPSFTARHEAFFGGQPGMNCSDLVGVAQGQYLALPCQVAYEIVGNFIE